MRTITFPNINNITYRSGFIKLTAFGSEFDQAEIEGNTASVVDKLKQTARSTTPDFEGSGVQYLDNAVKNMQLERSQMSGKVKFIAILPLPLGVKDSMAVEWNSSPSSFIDGAYGHIKKAGIGESSTYAAATTVLNASGNWVSQNTGLGMAAGFGDTALNFATNTLGAGSGQNTLVEHLINGQHTLSQSIVNSPAAQAYLKPGAGTKQILGMKSDQSLMQFHNEAAALNGVRQVIFDPGYWQSFQGVQPRGFTLSWDIIPENHEDAINGLEMCARIREFSLPQSVSGVELLSPCYWQVDWSNKYLDSQTLYSNLVVKNIEVDYAQNGEWHGASTPKMFRIVISFEEAKAPTADIYKKGANFIPVSAAAAGRGGSGRNNGRYGSGSGGGFGGGGAGGGWGSGSGGSVSIPVPGGSIPIPIPKDPRDPNFPKPGEIIKKNKDRLKNILGNIIDGITKGTGDVLGDKIKDILGDRLGGTLGAWADKRIDEATSRVGKVLKDAIESGDLRDLDDKIKDAVFSGTFKLSDIDLSKIGGKVGNKIEEVLGVDIPEDKFTKIFEKVVGGILEGLEPEDALKKVAEEIKDETEEKILGMIGGLIEPKIVEILKKLPIYKDPNAASSEP